MLADKIRHFYLDKEEEKEGNDDEDKATFSKSKEEKIIQMFGDAFVVGGDNKTTFVYQHILY